MARHKIIESIIQKFNNLETFDKRTIRKAFTKKEQEIILSAFLDKDEPFKIRLLRIAGYGRCITCGNQTPYISRKQFFKYCSKNCMLSHHPKR